MGCADDGRQDDIGELQNEVDALKVKISKIGNDIETLTLDTRALRIDSSNYSQHKTVVLSPGPDGFSTIASNFGMFTIKLTNVQPYARGTRATFRIGNLTNATITSYSAKFSWARVDENGRTQSARTLAETRSQTFAKNLKPGSWTTISVVTDELAPTELGYVLVGEFEIQEIELLK